jgi:hypothetical protein
VLVKRVDGCVMSQRPAHDAEASTSRAALPALGVVDSQPEQGQRHHGVLRALLDEAQAEQALWQEFRDHGTSLNNALTEALRLHEGPSFQLFEVSVFCLISFLFLVSFLSECSVIWLFSLLFDCCSQELEGWARDKYDRLS